MKKFKYGDKVILKDLDGCVAGFRIGDKCKIKDADTGGYYNIAIIKEEADILGFVNANSIEKIEEGNIVLDDELSKVQEKLLERLKEIDKIKDPIESLHRIDVLWNINQYLTNYEELKPVVQKFFIQKAKREKWRK